MLEGIFPIIQTAVVAVVSAFILLMLLRMLIVYLDPNPFGKIGRVAYRLRRFADKCVRPSADFLHRLNINTKIAPFVAILGVCIFGYFFLQLVGSFFGTIDGVAKSAAAGNVTRIIGHLIVGFLGLYTLMILMRIVFSWFVSFSNPIMRFLNRITDPILVPFRRLIPPLGVFDISAIVVIFILKFLQMAVAGVFLGS
jgi:YggT family protein